jgi:Dolichyl-phosphate-mannose-protein mannosyltransferase
MHRFLNLVSAVSNDLSWAPLFWPFAFFVPFFGLFVLRYFRPGWFASVANWARPICICGAVLVIAAFVGADLSYCLSSAFWDHNEPAVGIESWLFWRGDAVYQDLVTQQRYSGPYGPYGYMAIGLCQGLIGPGVFATKLLPCIAGALALALFYRVVLRRISASALLFTGLLAALSLRLGPFAFWTRPDPFLLLCVTTGLVAATRKTLAATILLGIAIGVAVNLKIHSVLYFIPVLVIAIRSGFDRGALAKVTGVALIVAILPFIFFPQVSIWNYLGMLRLIGKRGLGLLEFRVSIEWLITVSLPLTAALLAYRVTSRNSTNKLDPAERRNLAAFLIASVAILFFASKLGAGPHHFLPLIPVILFLAAEQREKGGGLQWRSSLVSVTSYALCFSWLLSCVLVGLGSACSISSSALRNEPDAAASIRDLKQLVDDRPAYIWLGGAPLGGQPLESSPHLELVFRGMPPGLIPPVQMDFQLARFREADLPALQKEIEEKYRKPIAWVVPKGSSPFGMKTAFDQSRPLFSQKAQQEFADRFQKAGSSRFFDFYLPR